MGEGTGSGKAHAQATAPTPALITAYRAAEYRVTGVAPPFILRVGEASAALAARHRLEGASESAFLSACNPGSRLAAGAANATAHERLASHLRALGYAPVAGIGADPAGEWPAEPSWWVPGIGFDAAATLGRAFGQHAILWAGADAVPRLVFLHEHPPRIDRGTDR